MTLFRAFLAISVLAVFGALTHMSAPAKAVVSFDQNITPDAIFGSGNANGGWTVDRVNSLELGLRAKVRFGIPGDAPANIFNSNGDGTYNHAAGAPAASPTRARWSFEFSINTDFLTVSGAALNSLTYAIGLDYDPGVGTNFLTFDPINAFPFADHSIGTNATGNGAGVEAANPGQYAALIAANNVAQNSWQLNFFPGPQPFDPNVDGEYSFFLAAFSSSTREQLARTDITVIVGEGASVEVPEPGTLGLLGVGLGAIGFVAYRRYKAGRPRTPSAA